MTIASAALLLFLILDPLGNIPVFLSMLRSLPSILWHVAREPRAAAGVIPSTVRHSFPIMERRWREDLQPRYRAAVAAIVTFFDMPSPLISSPKRR